MRSLLGGRHFGLETKARPSRISCKGHCGVDPIRNRARACAPEGFLGRAISNGVDIMDSGSVVFHRQSDLPAGGQRELFLNNKVVWSGPETGSFSLVSPGFGPTPDLFRSISSIQHEVRRCGGYHYGDTTDTCNSLLFSCPIFSQRTLHCLQ